MIKRIGIILGGGILLFMVLFGWWVFSRPERGTTGSVSTHFRLFGLSDKIVIDSFKDPKVPGVVCYIARAQTGGVKGELGLAEDTSDASISFFLAHANTPTQPIACCIPNSIWQSLP